MIKQYIFPHLFRNIIGQVIFPIKHYQQEPNTITEKPLQNTFQNTSQAFCNTNMQSKHKYNHKKNLGFKSGVKPLSQRLKYRQIFVNNDSKHKMKQQDFTCLIQKQKINKKHLQQSLKTVIKKNRQNKQSKQINFIFKTSRKTKKLKQNKAFNQKIYKKQQKQLNITQASQNYIDNKIQQKKQMTKLLQQMKEPVKNQKILSKKISMTKLQPIINKSMQFDSKQMNIKKQQQQQIQIQNDEIENIKQLQQSKQFSNKFYLRRKTNKPSIKVLFEDNIPNLDKQDYEKILKRPRSNYSAVSINFQTKRNEDNQINFSYQQIVMRSDEPCYNKKRRNAQQFVSQLVFHNNQQQLLIKKIETMYKLHSIKRNPLRYRNKISKLNLDQQYQKLNPHRIWKQNKMGKLDFIPLKQIISDEYSYLEQFNKKKHTKNNNNKQQHRQIELSQKKIKNQKKFEKKQEKTLKSMVKLNYKQNKPYQKINNFINYMKNFKQSIKSKQNIQAKYCPVIFQTSTSKTKYKRYLTEDANRDNLMIDFGLRLSKAFPDLMQKQY